jgi:tetratricopeptide (TPR) repeat protein
MSRGTIVRKSDERLVLETNKTAERIGLFLGVLGLFFIGALIAIHPSDTERTWGLLPAAIVFITAGLVGLCQNERIRIDKKAKILSKYEFFGSESSWRFDQLAYVAVAKVGGRGIHLLEIAIRLQNGRQEKLGLKTPVDAILFGLTVAEFVNVPINLPQHRSIEYVTLAIKKYPTDTRLLIVRGSLHRKAERFEDAMSDYSSALDADPKSKQARYGRGLVYADQRHFDLAIAEFSAALEHNEEPATALLLRAACYRLAKNFPAALADYNECIAMGQQSAHTLLSRGVVNAALGEADKACSDFNQGLSISEDSLKKNEKDTSALYCSAYAAARLGDFARGFDRIMKLLSIAPKFGQSHVYLAEMYCLRAGSATATPDSKKADVEKGLQSLEHAAKLRYNPADFVLNDDLAILRSEQRFQALCLRGLEQQLGDQNGEPKTSS